MTRTGLRRISAAIITALALAPFSTTSRAGWVESYEAGLRAMKSGDHDRAAELMKQSVAAAKKLGTETPEEARALAGLSDVYLAQEKTTEAGLLLERSLYLLAQAPGSNAADLARVYERLSRVRTYQGRYAEAEALLKQVLAFREKSLGPDHPDVAEILERLAGLCLFQKHGDASVPLEQRALAIRVKAAANSPARLVKSLYDQAQFEGFQGNEAGKETILKRALAVQERSLGDAHPDVATTLMKIASTKMELHEGGRFGVSVDDLANTPSSEELRARIGVLFREYEPLVKRALAIRERALGAEHPDTLQAIQYLAAGYAAVNDNVRAEPYLKRLLAASKKGSSRLGPSVGNEGRQPARTP